MPSRGVGEPTFNNKRRLVALLARVTALQQEYGAQVNDQGAYLLRYTRTLAEKDLKAMKRKTRAAK